MQIRLMNNIVSLFFEFVNKFFKLNNLPIYRSSYHFANLNGKFITIKPKYLHISNNILDLIIFLDLKLYDSSISL